MLGLGEFVKPARRLREAAAGRARFQSRERLLPVRSGSRCQMK